MCGHEVHMLLMEYAPTLDEALKRMFEQLGSGARGVCDTAGLAYRPPPNRGLTEPFVTPGAMQRTLGSPVRDSRRPGDCWIMMCKSCRCICEGTGECSRAG